MSADRRPLKPPHPLPRARGDEPFKGIDAQVADFWRWAFSDLRLNIVRGVLAEFLVAKAVDAADTPKEGWANFDVEAADGTRIEVKASAYWQSWPQRGGSKIVFTGLTGRNWQADGTYSVEREVKADVFAFAVQACEDPERYDPLNVEQWEFYVLSASPIREAGTRSISLAALIRSEAGPHRWGGLREAIRHAAVGSAK